MIRVCSVLAALIAGLIYLIDRWVARQIEEAIKGLAS